MAARLAQPTLTVNNLALLALAPSIARFLCGVPGLSAPRLVAVELTPAPEKSSVTLSTVVTLAPS